MKRAAVVIGVNRTGGLPVLDSAARGAREVADWLEAEGFEVVCLTDEREPVSHIAVRDAVFGFVTKPARYHQLVLYFSGHGQWHSRADHWLLSGAPTYPGEAVNLVSAADAAAASGIPSVVFISDACRSIPDTVTGQRVEASPIFPNHNLRAPTKVDSFCATGEGAEAFEGEIDGRPQSLLTAALRSAYIAPQPGMVAMVDVDGQPMAVVPNRRLEDFLQGRVDALLARIDRRREQRLEINVPSADRVFIARAQAVPTVPAAMPAPMPVPGEPPSAGAEPASIEPGWRPADAAPAPAPAWADAGTGMGAVRRELNERGFAPGGRSPVLAPQPEAVEGRVRRRLPDLEHSHFESGTGFVVQGAQVVEAVWRASLAGGALEAAVLEPGTAGAGGAPALVRVQGPEGSMHVPPQQVGSVALRFADGRCAVLAALPGYLAHVRVKASGVAHVNYVPSAYGFRWDDYAPRRAEADRLRALVALAAEHGVFRLSTDREAQALADRVRTGKSADPALGVYAAYAYAQAGRERWVLDVQRHMRDDLQAGLFDVRLLASRELGDEPFDALPLAPACPLLTQGWSLLAPRGVAVPAPLQRAAAHLCNSLWTTFEPAGADEVIAWAAGAGAGESGARAHSPGDDA